jgi:CDP-diacylglycerol--serine O-phosphatidyltransferase
VKKHIPNFITLLNLLSGCIAIVFVINSNFTAAASFVGLGIIFDFFDGFAARMLNVKSDLGLQLDSLADLITSGVVPGIVMFKLLELTVGAPDIIDQSNAWNAVFSFKGFKSSIIPIAGFAITLASAYRLAKFNIDEDQQTYFKGLPTPANALLILSLPLILEFQNSDLMNSTILNLYFLLVLTAVSCYLLNAPIKLFSLKFTSGGFAKNANRYIFLLLCIVTLIIFQFAAIPIIIGIYIGMSILDNISGKKIKT